MTTTLVRDSIVGDDWIKQTAANVPVQRLLGADGQPTGDILTGPVRLAFCDSIFEGQQNDSGETKYSVMMLFTPLFNPQVFYEEYYAWCGREFPQNYDAGSQQYYGLHSPFKDQAEKMQYGGFTPGCIAITSGSQYKPPVVDSRYNPIVDPNKLYPGVWAICAVRPYAYGKAGKTKDGKPMKKGIGFGLQSIMLIADDTRFGGGAPDAKQLFAGVKVASPVVRPDIGAGMPMGGAPAPAAGIPGYTTHAAGAPAPGFAMPQQTHTPPAQGFTPPAPNAAGYATAPHAAGVAPNMTTSPIETEEQRMMREMGLA